MGRSAAGTGLATDGPFDARGVALVAVLAAVLPYGASLSFGFALDDVFAITGHKGVRGPFSPTDLVLRDFWGRSSMDTIGSWRPVATLTYWIDWHLGGGRPWLFHATNLVLYAALLLLLERLLARLFDAALSAPTRCATVAIFGVLAMHADVVPSLAGRAEILATLFGVLAILLPLRPDGPVTPGTALASAGASTLAMASKESALPVALLAPLLAYRWHARRATATGRGMPILFASSSLTLAGIVGFRCLRMPWMALGPERGAENPLLLATWPVRMEGAAAVLTHYLAHLVWPWRLAPDYSYAALDPGHEPWLAAVGAVVAVAGGAALAAGWRRRMGVADAILGFAATYVTVSHVFVPAVAVMADRLFFFPSLWIVAGAAVAAEPAIARFPRTATALAAAAGMLQAAVAVRDGASWRDDVTLLTRAVAAQPNVARSRRNLAQTLAEHGRPDEAAWELVACMAILARYPGTVGPDELRPLDAMPPQARLAALGDRIGACALEDRLGEAQAAFHRWGLTEAETRVASWRPVSRAGCRRLPP